MRSRRRTTPAASRDDGPRAADGTRRGDPIPGSRFFRSFCARCGEPMRMEADLVNEHVLCNECDPPHIGVGGPTGCLDGLDADPDAWRPSFLAG